MGSDFVLSVTDSKECISQCFLWAFTPKSSLTIHGLLNSIAIWHITDQKVITLRHEAKGLPWLSLDNCCPSLIIDPT